MVSLLLNPGLENSEHYFSSVWDECNCVLEENNKMGKTRDPFKKIRDNREYVMQRWAQ